MGALMLPLVFTVGVSGDGQMLDTFVENLKERFPGVVVYDRNEEAERPDSDEPKPATPEVANIDVLFMQKGSKEIATIRRFHRHRLFNYDMKDNPPDSPKLYWLLREMMDAIDEFMKPPQEPPVAEPPTVVESPAESNESEASREHQGDQDDS